MDDQLRKLTRRQVLQAGAGVAGTLALLATGASNVLAQAVPISGRQDTQLVFDPDSNDSKDGDGDGSWEEVEAALGTTEGTMQPGGVFKFDLPRDDLSPTIAGISLLPDFAADTEITFMRQHNQAVVKYEFALLESEVNPVLDAMFAQHLTPLPSTLTGLHNHYLQDSPRIMFLHGFATGNAVTLAKAIYQALSQNSGTPFGHGPEPPGNPGFDTNQVTEIIGGDGQLQNGVLTVSVPRKESIHQRGIQLPSAMQVETSLVFQSIGNGNIAAAGEMTVLADEADAVSRTLRQRGVNVTALHNHELIVQPQLYYLHVWATGAPSSVAQALRDGLSHTNSKFK